ncbi:hypothetical protein DYB37_009544 [Aphanomyces astaci]|uniref:Cyclin N-terminal domain-containing protein n=1 Tax=Aphanomyces astaci TaxID=112090 RepID=A0A418EIH8_APHAT|nr:hypothetical protein DYB37_009544 [Aphanomyces astaci]
MWYFSESELKESPFFVVQSFKRQDAWLIAATCLFLAAKVEEHYMKAVDFSKHYLAYRRKLCHDAKKVEGGSRVYPSEPATSPTVEAMTDELLFTECLVLHVLAYDLGVVHPHAYVNEFVSLSMAHVDASEDMAVELKRAAWSFLNDSSNTCLCLRFEPRVITAVAVYLAGLYLSHWTQPLTGSGPQTWWASVAIPVDVLEGLLDTYATGFAYKQKPLPSGIVKLFTLHGQPNPEQATDTRTSSSV